MSSPDGTRTSWLLLLLQVLEMFRLGAVSGELLHVDFLWNKGSAAKLREKCPVTSVALETYCSPCEHSKCLQGFGVFCMGTQPPFCVLACRPRDWPQNHEGILHRDNKHAKMERVRTCQRFNCQGQVSNIHFSYQGTEQRWS